MNYESREKKFVLNEFYERLINLRLTNPASFARFAAKTNERLQAYEEAKGQAAIKQNSTIQKEDNYV
jgi:hypothetical protein